MGGAEKGTVCLGVATTAPAMVHTWKQAVAVTKVLPWLLGAVDPQPDPAGIRIHVRFSAELFSK